MDIFRIIFIIPIILSPSVTLCLDPCNEVLKLHRMDERGDLESLIKAGNRLQKTGIEDRYISQIIAMAYYEKKEYDNSIIWLNKAISYSYICGGLKPRYNGLNDELDTATLHYILSKALSLNGEEEKSEIHYQTAFNLLKGAFGNDFTEEKANWYFNIVSKDLN